ncbi:hypothetical protein BDFB_006719 [Asbolus verrucosus]|uniref:Uncharacterized protein n=1 Tax=Asbolus verrucosus TaxID=1661398 RepID=A0A482V127_ASBVE|nr:hypothetical protein BDFB_006719 [Asbolus verrucosus]
MFLQPLKYQQPIQQQQVHQVHQLQPIHHLQPVHQVQQIQQKPHFVPVQIIPKSYFVTQPQPHAMIIIAQPALLPQSLVYGNPTQQLLNYFHNNPQAKYQLLHGNYQQPQQVQPQHVQPQPVQPTATYMHHVMAAPTIGSYILTPAPQLQQITHPITAHQVAAQPQVALAQTNPVQAPATQVTQQPTQLSSIAQLAQLAAQQYVSSQLKTAPAIVTGFENFTPEQQAQIKAQLSSHLGTNFHAVSSPANQYSAKYVADQESNDFVPSPQIKNDPVTTVSSTGDILKTRYLKGKN